MNPKTFRGATKSLAATVRNFLGSLRREWRILRATPPDDASWIFVVGCYNSGTTLLADLLGRHPLISALPTEGHFLSRDLVKDYEVGLPRMWVKNEDLFRLRENDPGPSVRRLKKEWCARLDTSKPFLLEKSPPNGARTRWLQHHFENPHFIVIVRDGFAVSEGIRRKAEPPGGRWSIDEAAWQWARSNEVLLEDSERLAKVVWLRYEDLTERPQATLQKISDFLGIPWSDHWLPDDSIAVHERRERLSNLNAESHGRLSREDIDVIQDKAQKMLEQFGYIRPQSGPPEGIPREVQ